MALGDELHIFGARIKAIIQTFCYKRKSEANHHKPEHNYSILQTFISNFVAHIMFACTLLVKKIHTLKIHVVVTSPGCSRQPNLMRIKLFNNLIMDPKFPDTFMTMQFNHYFF